MASLCQLHAMAANEAAAQQASTARYSLADVDLCAICLSVKVGQLAEEDKAFVDLFAGELLKTLGAKALARKRTHHAAIEHSVAKGTRGERGLRRQVAEKAARKAVARARRVNYLFKRQRRRPEGLRPFILWTSAVECRCPILSMLDDQRLGAQRQHATGRLKQVALSGQHARLSVVDE